MPTVVGCMQPYFFPYIGYFQLLASCDVFVFHDDVQYIKGGWINRNRILRAGHPEWLTLPVAHAPHALPIVQRHYQKDSSLSRALGRRIDQAYRRAPFFQRTMPLVETLLAHPDDNVARYNAHCVSAVAAHIGITRPRILSSSSIPKDDTLTGTQRVMAICEAVGGSHYLNSIGGTSLYDPLTFHDRGLRLGFVRPKLGQYAQGGPEFVPGLSIIDVLMFNDIADVRRQLLDFTVEGDAPDGGSPAQ